MGYLRVARAHVLLASLLGAAWSASAGEAWAQPAEPSPPAPAAPARPLMVPPKALEVSNVAYPEGARGDATVVLVLVIDADGTVKSADVESGLEPFGAAAVQAALAWRFAPATRDGVPIFARIRYEVAFVYEPPPPPEPDPAAPVAERAPTAPGAGAAAPTPKVLGDDAFEGAIDVDAVGFKAPPGVSSLSRAEVRQLPGAFGDPFRAIEILPGVTPIVSGLPFFYVRGAPPGNVGYFLDGVRVPYLFHAAAGPSVIHPGIVERVDLHAGGYPAQYGRYAGAIVAAETTAPRTDWHGEGNVRIVDAGALVEGGFADDRGTALVAGRYSYTAGLFSLISPEITLDYRDYQARVTYDLTSRDRLTLFAFGAYDFLSSTENEIETVIFGSEFYRVDGRYDAQLEGGGSIRAATTFGFDQTRVADGRNTQDVLFGSRLVIKQPVSDTLTVRGGLDVQHDVYTADERRFADPDDPGTQSYNRLFPPRSDAAASVFTDVVWQLDPRLLVTPGLRLDTFYSNGEYALSADPRLAVEVDVMPGLRLLHAVGLAHQTPAFVVPVPGLAVASLDGGLQRAVQASAGVEVALPWSTTATVNVFDSVFSNMSDTLGVSPGGANDNLLPRSEGHAYGLEVYVRRSLSSRLGGFISYTLSRSTRTIDGQKFPAAFDRTHVLHSALGYDLGRNWRAGTRFSIYSGPPSLGQTATGGQRPLGLSRDPAFYRLDFRLEKKWKLGQTSWISFVAEMLNATLNTETINGNEVGPVTIPSLGVEAGF